MKDQKGFSLIETIIYLGLLLIISVVVSNGLLTLMRAFGAAEMKSDLTNNATLASQRMEREIRRARSVSAITIGDLTLDTGARFCLSAAVLKENCGSANEAPLTETRFNLSSLSFYATSSAKSKLVSFAFVLGGERFFGSALLRGSY